MKLSQLKWIARGIGSTVALAAQYLPDGKLKTYVAMAGAAITFWAVRFPGEGLLK